MKRIKFTRDTVFETFGPNHPDNPRFVVDQVETMKDDQAERWLKRGRAELVEDLGPDMIEGADPIHVAEVEAKVEQRIEDEVEAELEKLDKAAERLEQETDDDADETA